jgi:hypothetical protein
LNNLDWLRQALPFLIPILILQLGLMVFCLVDLSKREHTRGVPKWMWALIIILGEMVGPIIYLLLGRREE